MSKIYPWNQPFCGCTRLKDIQKVEGGYPNIKRYIEKQLFQKQSCLTNIGIQTILTNILILDNIKRGTSLCKVIKLDLVIDLHWVPHTHGFVLRVSYIYEEVWCVSWYEEGNWSGYNSYFGGNGEDTSTNYYHCHLQTKW